MGFRIVLLCCVFAFGAVHSMHATAPQMGWNTWNAFKLDYTATDLIKTADLLVSTGLRDAGYEYLIVDEGWLNATRASDGRQQPNATVFPKGITDVIDHAHAEGLKFGLYSDSGFLTCGRFPGSLGYEELDAQTYSNWGVDYLKYDNCGGFAGMVDAPEVRFSVMRNALLNVGRPIFYSLCEWGFQFPWYWADQIGQSYRISGDIASGLFSDQGTDCACKTAYCLNTGYAGCSVLTIIRKMREISPFQHPGSYADMDLLQIGNGNMTLAEQRTHLSFWSALKSPLIIGTDISKLSNDSVSILKKAEILALNQDVLGKAAVYVPGLSLEYHHQLWVGPLNGGRSVVLVMNEQNQSLAIEVDFTRLNVSSGGGKLSAIELWSGKHYPRVAKLALNIEAHDTQVFVVHPS